MILKICIKIYGPTQYDEFRLKYTGEYKLV